MWFSETTFTDCNAASNGGGVSPIFSYRYLRQFDGGRYALKGPQLLLSIIALGSPIAHIKVTFLLCKSAVDCELIGGAIAVSESVSASVTQCQFILNNAQVQGIANFKNCIRTYCFAGGAISSDTFTSVVCVDSNFYSNIASKGGAVSTVSYSAMTFDNCIMNNNSMSLCFFFF